MTGGTGVTAYKTGDQAGLGKEVEAQGREKESRVIKVHVFEVSSKETVKV